MHRTVLADVKVCRRTIRRNSMAHCGYIGKIKPGKVDDYVKAHEEVWPELIEVMKKAGLEKEICFLYGNHVFIYREAADLDGALDKLSREPLNQKWDEYM